MSPASPSTSFSSKQLSPSRWLLTGMALCGLIAVSGCSRFRAHPETQYVYVIAKQSILRDRVAAVSNRVGEVTNGEKLQVLEQSRRFVKVKTPNGTIGWLEARLTADQGIADQFDALRQRNAKDPVVAAATARDDVYLHVSPGRETDRFYRLAEGDPVSLLQRAAVTKPLPPGAIVADTQKKPEDSAIKGKANLAAPVAPPPPAMEDWWLVRGAQGQTGWVYSRLLDVTVPDTLARYAEGRASSAPTSSPPFRTPTPASSTMARPSPPSPSTWPCSTRGRPACPTTSTRSGSLYGTSRSTATKPASASATSWATCP